MTNRDKINKLSNEELLKYFSYECIDCPCDGECDGEGQDCDELLKRWLDKEIDDEVEEEKNTAIEYYAIENTADEEWTQITGKYKTLNEAKEDLWNHSDWYCSKGTGKIYAIKQWFEGFDLKENKVLVFERTEEDVKNAKTNYERIKEMSKEEMSVFFDELKQSKCKYCGYEFSSAECEHCDCDEGILKWLERKEC